MGVRLDREANEIRAVMRQLRKKLKNEVNRNERSKVYVQKLCVN